jgi:hypothetical protein
MFKKNEILIKKQVKLKEMQILLKYIICVGRLQGKYFFTDLHDQRLYI